MTLVTRRGISKSAPSLKKGDVVAMHGGRFEVLADAVSVNCSTFAHGPSDLAAAPARCLSGEVRGYFWPGSSWTFQGNRFSSFAVEVNAGVDLSYHALRAAEAAI